MKEGAELESLLIQVVSVVFVQLASVGIHLRAPKKEDCKSVIIDPPQSMRDDDLSFLCYTNTPNLSGFPCIYR